MTRSPISGPRRPWRRKPARPAGASEELLRQLQREARRPARLVADQAFSRAAGAPLVPGNRVRLLVDATENYPAWLDAIESASRTIHFESYIIHDDSSGRMFAEALAEKARQGVRVRLIYDWMGALGHAGRRFWRRLEAAGVEVRCFNPPRFASPLGWVRRDHRKMLAVDGRVGFITGLCVGRMWVGDPEKGIEPWRDTGIEIRGPALADVERAFADMWSLMGPPIPPEDLVDPDAIAPAGDVAMRIVASYPNMAGLYRLDQLIGALARRYIWLSDAYFLGTAAYVQSLRAAALDGVDVRLLLPAASDVPVVRSLSRAGYRGLLEAGVRIFEWNGPMMHAKTAVTDGRWARVGSTNLNIASWMGNWELDAVIEDETFAHEMEQMYLNDLARSTEIVLDPRHRLHPAEQRARFHHRPGQAGSAGRAMRSLLRAGYTVGAAITSRRTLGPAEIVVLVSAAVLLLCLAVVGALWPRLLVVPFVVFSVWLALSLLLRAWRLHRRHR